MIFYDAGNERTRGTTSRNAPKRRFRLPLRNAAETLSLKQISGCSGLTAIRFHKLSVGDL